MGREAIPQNLRRIRQQKGWSQQEIAEKAGLSLSGYCKIEKGQSVPGVSALERLVRALEIPEGIQALLRPMYRLEQVRFRSQRKLKSREQVLVDAARWYHDYASLEEMLKDKQEFKLRDLALTGTGITRAKQAAADARVHLGLGKEAVVNPCGLIEDMGVKVLKLVVATEGFFGLSINDVEGGPAVVVNVWDRISVERWIFSAFHEVGHLLLHTSSYKVGESEDDDAEEQEANAFASYFLMPHDAFTQRWNETAGHAFVNRVLKVKRIFKVSYRSVLYRLLSVYREEKDLFQKFAVHYRSLYGRNLAGHYEPPPQLSPTDFDHHLDDRKVVPEVDPLSRNDFREDRLEALVRRACLKEEISFNRAAEILGKPLEEMREVAATWNMDRSE